MRFGGAVRARGGVRVRGGAEGGKVWPSSHVSHKG